MWNYAKEMQHLRKIKVCIICGTMPIEMHNLRKIKDLRDKNREVGVLTAQMIAINRKQVPLCKVHHDKIQGKLGGLSPTERNSFEDGFPNCRDILSGCWRAV
jgi:hypothetical protein